MRSECRIGFVGAGGVADRHARMLARTPGVDVVAVTDVAPARAHEFAERHGARPVAGLDALLDTRPDAVYVCVPPFAHGELEQTIARAGLPLYVEKPIGLDLEQPQRIAAVLAETGVITSVGHHWRYSKAVHLAQQVLADRPVRLVLGTWLDKVPPVPWWPHRERSGGQLIEQAVHVLDLLRLLAGEVDEVHAFADGTPPVTDADVDGATAAVLRLTSGAVGTLVATCRLSWKHRAGLEIYADDLVITLTEDALTVRDGRGTQLCEEFDPDQAKLAADAAFVRAVAGDTAVSLVPYDEALRTHRLACAMALSAAHRRPVEVASCATSP